MEKNQLIRPRQLAKKLGINLVTLWRWRKQNKIPQPIQLGSHLIAWRESTIEEWLAEKEKTA
ncbi:helix-turn-helix transcriptional regulator [Thalassotalea sp. PLHSN55]|uniref:helix-turn-helix transcriptional regulator n=1 Tax=Thalassotalea sp. PLHSN55 TaxID=3435888 RepID=UPI003F8798C7